MNRVRLITVVTLFFASHLVDLLRARPRRRAASASRSIIWIGVFNLMVPAQLWAFANDVYTNERGKRLLPMVGIGASLGAWVGAELASRLFGGSGHTR